MPTVLGLSTSTALGGAAILVEGRIVGARSYDDARGHAERIFGAIDGALADAGLDRRSIRIVACDVGPGSFTGVRVGVASAKGIALGLGATTIPVGSLEAVAHAAFSGGEAALDELVFASLTVRGTQPAAGAEPEELIVAVLDAQLDALVAPRIVTSDDATIAALVDEVRRLDARTPRFVGAWPEAVVAARGGGEALPAASAVAELAALRLGRLGAAAFGELDARYVRDAVVISAR